MTSMLGQDGVVKQIALYAIIDVIIYFKSIFLSVHVLRRGCTDDDEMKREMYFLICWLFVNIGFVAWGTVLIFSDYHNQLTKSDKELDFE